jgi:hypothetical protein
LEKTTGSFRRNYSALKISPQNPFPRQAFANGSIPVIFFVNLLVWQKRVEMNRYKKRGAEAVKVVVIFGNETMTIGKVNI